MVFCHYLRWKLSEECWEDYWWSNGWLCCTMIFGEFYTFRFRRVLCVVPPLGIPNLPKDNNSLSTSSKGFSTYTSSLGIFAICIHHLLALLYLCFHHIPILLLCQCFLHHTSMLQRCLSPLVPTHSKGSPQEGVLGRGSNKSTMGTQISGAYVAQIREQTLRLKRSYWDLSGISEDWGSN